MGWSSKQIMVLWLVVSTPSEKYESKWTSSPIFGVKNRKYFEVSPPSFDSKMFFGGCKTQGSCLCSVCRQSVERARRCYVHYQPTWYKFLNHPTNAMTKTQGEKSQDSQGWCQKEGVGKRLILFHWTFEASGSFWIIFVGSDFFAYKFPKSRWDVLLVLSKWIIITPLF